jgi:predicted ester cyclase
LLVASGGGRGPLNARSLGRAVETHQGETMGSVEQNIEIIKRAVAAANDGTLPTVARDIISSEFVLHDLNELPGVAGSGLMQTLRSAMPDLRVTVEDLFGAGDRVAVRIHIMGTHDAAVLGISPTGRRVQFSGINIYRLEHGKIVESWQLPDFWSFMSQVGFVRSPGEEK